MADSQQYGFVFAVTFIIMFSALLSSIPVGFQGKGSTADTVIPVNPNLLNDFAEKEEWTGETGDFILLVVVQMYVYDLPIGGTTYECFEFDGSFYMSSHTLFIGLWLGGVSPIEFTSENGTKYGQSVSFSDLDNDEEDGAVRYTLQYSDSGNSVGGLVLWWNTTTYTGSEDAWDNDKLYFLHGIGITGNTDIASLLISLLFLQLPEVPTLVNLLLVVPMWASIIFVLWFIIKEMIPFLG